MTGEELKALRNALGLTQQELADELGVARNAVTQWEMGVRPILKITQLALATVARRTDRIGMRPGERRTPRESAVGKKPVGRHDRGRKKND
jgi:transcriptional regulator with XRE-family HTH domain